MDLQLYQMDAENYLVDFRNVGYRVVRPSTPTLPPHETEKDSSDDHGTTTGDETSDAGASSLHVVGIEPARAATPSGGPAPPPPQTPVSPRIGATVPNTGTSSVLDPSGGAGEKGGHGMSTAQQRKQGAALSPCVTLIFCFVLFGELTLLAAGTCSSTARAGSSRPWQRHSLVSSGSPRHRFAPLLGSVASSLFCFVTATMSGLVRRFSMPSSFAVVVPVELDT